MRRLIVFVIFLLPLIAVSGRETSLFGIPLHFENSFKSPDELVRYICELDATGQIVSGLLQKEVSEFTLWEEAPRPDGFFVATKYAVSRPMFNPTRTEAKVYVRYDLVDIRDIKGARMPASSPTREVLFSVKWSAGKWKLAAPHNWDYNPVLIRGRALRAQN